MRMLTLELVGNQAEKKKIIIKKMHFGHILATFWMLYRKFSQYSPGITPGQSV